MGGRGSRSGMTSSGVSGGGGSLKSSNRTSGAVPNSKQAADDMYDELTNHAYQPRAAEFAANMAVNGQNDLNYEMNRRYGYGHNNGSAGEADPALIRAQQEGARRWINDNPDKVNTAIKNSKYNPTATRISRASPYSKSPNSAPAGTVLRMDDWKFTKNKSGSWTASKGGKRQPNRTNADIKKVFS